MLFGESLFQSVLTRLEAERLEAQEGEDAAPDSADGLEFRIRGLGGSFIAEQVAVQHETEQAYRAVMDDAQDTMGFAGADEAAANAANAQNADAHSQGAWNAEAGQGPNRHAEPDDAEPGDTQSDDAQPDHPQHDGARRSHPPPDDAPSANARPATATTGTPRVDQAPEPPAHLQRQSREEVERDLALTPRDRAEDLAEKRRSFARTNHPDTVHPAFRALAETRMKIANRLIDDALSLLAATSRRRPQHDTTDRRPAPRRS